MVEETVKSSATVWQPVRKSGQINQDFRLQCSVLGRPANWLLVFGHVI
jgi:hypothetical protein